MDENKSRKIKLYIIGGIILIILGFGSYGTYKFIVKVKNEQ